MYTLEAEEAGCDKRMLIKLVELTQEREGGLIEVRFANAAEHRRKVSREFDIIIRSETGKFVKSCQEQYIFHKLR